MSNSEIYQKIVENFGEGVWLSDDKNNTIHVNRKMEEMLGYSPGEMNGRSVFDFMDLEGAETTRKKLIRRREGIKEKHEFVLLHKKGHKIWTMMATCPLSKEDGAYAGAIAIVSDLTDKKRKEVLLEAQRNIFKILANNGTLKEALTELVTGLEILIDGAEASILVLDNEEKKITSDGISRLPRKIISTHIQNLCLSSINLRDSIINDDLNEDWARNLKIKSLWSFPICDGKVLGVVLLSFENSKKPSKDILGLIQDFKSAARLSIEYILTRRKEKTQILHADILSTCRKELAETLQYEQVIEKIPHILTKDFADWCFVTLINEEGYLEIIGSSAVSEKKSLIKRFESYRPDLNAEHGVPRAMREKKAFLYPELSDSDLLPGTNGWPKFGTKDEHYLEIVKLLGFRSMIVAPFKMRGSSIGGITIVSSDPEKRFNQVDLDLIDEVAHSCSVAIDNANLYHRSQKSVKAREEFISIASHELRTPLTSLKLRIDLLSRVMEKGNIPPEIVKKLNPILRELKPDLTKFSTLVETLLDISKIGSDKLLLHSTKCDVTETILSEVNRFKEVFSSKNIAFFTTIEENMKGHCDSVRIQQVISNLLTNAMKFSKNNPVHLTARKRGDLLIIEVIDKGIGISQEDMQRIFSPFERAVSDKNFGGLGLGLYISKQIIESHGGRILVESQFNEGTKFSVELPILQPTS